MNITLKTLLFFYLALLIFPSCKKSKKPPNIFSEQIVMATPIVTGNSIKISWTALANDSLMNYSLVKVLDTANPSHNFQRISIDKNTTQYTDTFLLEPYAQYHVEAILYANRSIVSNKAVVTRNDITFFNIVPTDAVFDRNANMIYMYNNTGDMAVYDVQNKKLLNQISTGAPILSCTLGTNNGMPELYVARKDGLLLIYNSNLVQTDQINLGIESNVVSYNGMLFFAGNEQIISYNRSTKTQISSTRADLFTGSGSTFLRMAPNSNLAIFSIDYDWGPRYFTFDAAGHFVSMGPVSVMGGTYEPQPFEAFPDGNRIIFGSTGVIYDKNSTYITTLPHASDLYSSSNYSSFTFDSTNQLIYASTRGNSILAYSTYDYHLTKTINTIGRPIKIFYNNGQIICVSTNYSNTFYPVYFFPYYALIEQF